MQTYELTIVMSGKTTPAKKKAQIEKIEKSVKSAKGNFLKTVDWGNIPLAYKIKKENVGVFTHFLLELDRGAVRAFEQGVKMDEGIIRHLLVKTN